MEDLDKRNRLPIDRGWAWVITIASCGTFGFVSGHFKIQGVIYVELLERFPHASAQSILWIFGLWSLLNRGSGPLAGTFLTKASTRTVSITGVVLMSSSLIVFAYLPSYEYMYIVYGAVCGIGAGMVGLSSLTAPLPYFEKKKALSVGITCTGSGIAAVILPLVIHQLFKNYSFEGALLLYAGVCLQMLIFSAFLRPFSFYERHFNAMNNKFKVEGKKQIQVFQTKSKTDYDENFRQRSCSNTTHKASQYKAERSTDHTKVFLSLPHQLQGKDNSSEKKHSGSFLAYSISDLATEAVVFTGDSYSESITDSSSSTAKTEKLSLWRIAINPKSITVGIATFLHVAGFGVAFQCLPALGESSGVEKRLVALLLSVFGIIEVPCRLINGWIADRGFISTCTLLAINIISTGVAAFIGSLISGLAGMVILVASFSTVGCSAFSLIPIVNGELLGTKNVQSATAINFAYQGLANVFSTFSAGLIYESTKSWESVFIFAGGVCTASGFIILLLRVFIHFSSKKQKDWTAISLSDET